MPNSRIKSTRKAKHFAVLSKNYKFVVWFIKDVLKLTFVVSFDSENKNLYFKMSFNAKFIGFWPFLAFLWIKSLFKWQIAIFNTFKSLFSPLLMTSFLNSPNGNRDLKTIVKDAMTWILWWVSKIVIWVILAFESFKKLGMFLLLRCKIHHKS